MGVRWTRSRAVGTPLLAASAVLTCVAAGVLLAAAAPYLGPLEVWTLPATGAAYGAVAAYAARSRPPVTLTAALLGASAALAAPALSLGLAQRSGSWVAVGAVAGLAAPAVGWVCVVTLRGDPSGSFARRALLAAVAVAGATALVRVLVQDPAAWGWYRVAGNPWALSTGPDVYVDLRPWLTTAHLGVVALVVLAVGHAFWTRPGRRGAAELVLVGGLLLAAAGWAVADVASLRGVPTSAALPVLAAGLLAVLAVHVLGTTRHRPSRAHVADLLLAARERSDPVRLRELVARALGDPAVAVYWWSGDSGTYVDHLGHPATVGVDAPSAHVLDVESDRRPIARVVTQRPLVDDPAILEPVAEALRLSIENRLLQEELAASLEAVRESRSRIVQASDEARRRIERDLHDGAQQLLISTGAKLNLASARVDVVGDRELADALADASDELGRALAELRSLARGITPTALVHGSLADALEDLALRCPVPATLHVTGTAPAQPEAAATAYFVVAECLANVARHSGASAAQVEVRLEDPLCVVVRDDGSGGADPSAGSGLKGLADRVEALGGTLSVGLGLGTGTGVTATLPNATP